MKHSHQTISILPECTNSIEQSHVSVILNKDLWLGECLDDYLFKLCGTDQVVWIPRKYLHHSHKSDYSFEATIPLSEQYCCAQLMISNAIRMCLINQHMVKGNQLLPFLAND